MASTAMFWLVEIVPDEVIFCPLIKTEHQNTSISYQPTTDADLFIGDNGRDRLQRVVHSFSL